MHVKRYSRKEESEDEHPKEQALPSEGCPASDHQHCRPRGTMANAATSQGLSNGLRTPRAPDPVGAEDYESASFVHRPLPLSLGSSSFKLMPRNLSAMSGASPSTLELGFLGTRKRRAHSIGSSSSCSDEEQQDSNLSHFGKEDYSSPLTSSLASGLDGMLKFEALTIQSPTGGRPVFKPNMIASPAKLRNQSNVLSGGSSFSLYVSSPAESIQRTCSDSFSISTNSVSASRTPSGSTKSSPRQVPLVIIPTTMQQVQACSPSRFQPYDGRPPFHINASRVHRREENAASPQRSSRFLSSCVDDMAGPDAWKSSTRSSEDPLTPRTSGASPRTPLPRITLTPRTPLSSQRNKPTSLPVFPSPTRDVFDDNDDLGRMMDDLLDGFEGYVASSPRATHDHDEPARRLTFNPDASDLLATSRASVEIGTPPDVQMLGSTLKQESLQSGGERADTQGLKANPALTLSRCGAFPSEVIRADASAVDADTGSLSDSDEEGFVLTCPLSHAIDNRRRVKQRLLSGKDSGNELSAHGSLGAMTSNQCSNTSLFGMSIFQDDFYTDSSSNTRAMTPFSGLSLADRRASATTMLYRDDDLPIASISNSALSRRDGECTNLNRGKSELSFASIGLCLEEFSGDFGRDLVTPPAIIQHTRSSPPLFKKPVE